MTAKLRLLLVEDQPTDAELILREVRRAGYDPDWRRVETEAEFLAALGEGFEFILADYKLPQFSGPRALELLNASGMDVPLIIVSGTIGEERAVAAMKAGAKDYVMKDRLARLGPVIERELRETGSRRNLERARQALVGSELRYRRLFESAKDGILILDAETGSVVDVNPFLIELLGLSRAEFLAKKVWELGFFKDLVANEANFEELKQKAYIRYEDMALETHDGRRIEVEFISNVYLVEDHKVIQCNIRDVSERIETARALRLQSAALNAASSSIVITDRNGTIAWSNPAFTAVTGYSASETIGRNPRDLVKSGAHGKDFYAEMWRTILAGKVWSGELLNRRKDGTLYPEEMAITPILDTHGDITHFVAIKQDLTHHRQLEDELRQAQKMESIGRLAGGIAHDFNNLLTVILGTADLAAATRAEDPTLVAELQVVRQAGEQAARLTRQLLAFSRRQVLQPQTLNLNLALGEMLDMLRRVLGEDVKMVFDPQEDLGLVDVDPGQIEQVVVNLAVNARDATPAGGTITIETRNVELDEAFVAGHRGARAGPCVMLAVSDTGSGMDEATRLQIFEPFFTTKAPGKGTGLGLSTVYGIVKQSGGSIWAESEPGRGSCFRIYLPVSAKQEQVSAPGSESTARFGSETILVVEDEAALRRLARRLLEKDGYTVLEAPDGAEALASLELSKTQIDLVLTDVVMPSMSGREFADQLARRFPAVKVLFTSGYTQDAMFQQDIGSSAACFLPKPYSAASLRRKIREVLDRPSAGPTPD